MFSLFWCWWVDLAYKRQNHMEKHDKLSKWGIHQHAANMKKAANFKFLNSVFLLPNCFVTNYKCKVQLNTNSFMKSQSTYMAAANSTNHREWHPENVISGAILPKSYACLVINRRVSIPSDVVEKLWQNAEYRCTVDGGTNRWRDYLLTHNKGNQLKLPDFITGDFDSITEETSNYFNNPSIQRVHTPDQNYTDFTKALHVLEPFLLAKDINDLIVFHDTSGRLDHIMANIHTLYLAKPTLNVYLLGGSSITWLLRPGQHTIHIPKDLVENQRWCSLLPVGGKAIVTSKGLKWDLSQSVLEFGSGIVSSSNTYSSQRLHIESNNSIVWSMGVFDFNGDY